MNRTLSPFPEVFVSYASRDHVAAVRIVDELQTAGVSVWQDQQKILGGENYGAKIVEGIKNCKVLLLLCSEASMRSKNVKQEIQLAWRYDRPYLPLLIEPMIHYPEQIEYWLEGWQRIEIVGREPRDWLPRVLNALSVTGVKTSSQPQASNDEIIEPKQVRRGLNGLRSVARFTDQIWPLPATAASNCLTTSLLRDLGAPQDYARHVVRLRDRVCLAIESDQPGHLLLLDEGASGKIYCLCPSAFAPDTQLKVGRSLLPQPGAPCESFVVTGRPGREHLLAIISTEPLGLNWIPTDRNHPARELTPDDVEQLLRQVRTLDENKWIALATYFDVE